MIPRSPKVQEPVLFAENFEFDFIARRLKRGDRVLKVERIPLEILALLLEHWGETVPREEIVARVWGEGVFLDTDNSIRGAIRKLRQVLRDDAETPRFIQTVTGQGYRFIAPITPSETALGQELSTTEPEIVSTVFRSSVLNAESLADRPSLGTIEPVESQLPGTEPDRRRLAGQPRKRLIGVFLTTLAVASVLSLFALWGWRSSRAPAAPQRKTILAVLPFDNLSRDPDQDFFSEGLTEEMIAQVGKLDRDRLKVVARSSVAKYKGSTLTARQIGKELNADYLVQGSVQRSSDRIRITVQLIQARDQIDLWTESYDRELKDVLVVQESVVRSIASGIHFALTEEEEKRLSAPRQVSPEAYEAYLKGRYYWNKRTGESMQKAEQYFQQAIDKDPTYAAAYSGMADCNSGLAWHGFKSPAEALPKAYGAARKALELDPQSAEAHASLGLVRSHGWNWSGAEAEFRRALELDPQYANAHHWFADYLSIQSRHSEALVEAKRALELDPLNLMISAWLGLRYYLARDYSHAIEQNRSSVELDPNFAAAHLLLGEDYLQSGSHSQGLSELTRAASLSGGSPLYTAQVGVALATEGRNDDALRIARNLERMSDKRYVSPYGLAQIYAALNDSEKTFQWLQAAYDDHAVWMGYLGVDPIFDRYRSDARFKDLLRQVNTP